MARTRGTPSWGPARRREGPADGDGRRSTALDGLVRKGDGVLILGLEEAGEDAWAVLAASGLRLLRVADAAAAMAVIANGAAQVVVADPRLGPGLSRRCVSVPSWPRCMSSSAPISTRRMNCAKRSTAARTTSCASRSSRRFSPCVSRLGCERRG